MSTLFEHVCTSLHAGLRRLVLVGNSDSWDEEPAATSGVPTGMVWPELGAGLSPLVAGCDHWTSPMDFAGADMGSERRRPLHDLLCNGDAGLCQQVVVRSLLIQEGEEGANVARG